MTGHPECKSKFNMLQTAAKNDAPMAQVRRAHSRSLFVMMTLLFVAGMWIAWTKWLVTNTSLSASNRLCILNLMIGECCFSKRRRYQRTWIARNARPLANLLHLRLKVRGSWFWFRLFQISGQIWPLKVLRLFGAVNDRIMCLPKNFCHYSAVYSAESVSVIWGPFCCSAETVFFCRKYIYLPK